MKNIENPLSNVSKNENLSEDSVCPSCLSERVANSRECTYCGIVYSQYYRWSKEKRTKLTISGLYHLNVADIEALETAWDRIESAYISKDTHEKFLLMCLRLKSLPFAAHCYKRRLEIFPDDDIARLQLDKVISLAKDWFGLDVEEERTPFNTGLMRIAVSLSAFGIVTGIVTLFAGLLTKNPTFYLVAGTLITLVFTFLLGLTMKVAKS